MGHGVGQAMHEEPQIPNYRPKTRDKGMTNPRFVKGMTIAVEPMINMGGKRIELLPDKWTVVTVDRKLSAHYENTLVITDGEPLLLTM